jgi:branched-chain amino acid transport system permease protein
MTKLKITRSTRVSRLALVLALGLIAALVAAPWWGTTANLRLIEEMLFYLALASMWNLLAGYAGLLSIGQHAYVGLGGYVLFSCTLFGGMNPLAAIPVSALVGGALALPVAWLVFRLKGPYFAIGTWVVAEVFRLSAAQMSALGGGSGLSLPIEAMKSIGSKSERELIIYLATLAVCLGAVVVIYLLLRSRIGLALTAIRDNEVASASLGIGIGGIKLVTYVVVGAVSSMVGTLVFLTKLRITPDAAFSVNDWTVFVVLMVVIGGIGTIEGPILGTVLYFLLREYLADLGAIYLMILGGLAIIIMLWAPQGIWGLIVKRFDLSLFPVGYRIRGGRS